jgi:DNA-directed RNA polymerase specialized sigma24 family protein
MNKWASEKYLPEILRSARSYDDWYNPRTPWDQGRPHEFTGPIFEEFIKLLDRHDSDKGEFLHYLRRSLKLKRLGYAKSEKFRIKGSTAEIEQFRKPKLEHPSAGDDDLGCYVGEGSDGSPDNFEHVEALTEDDLLGSFGQRQPDSTWTLDDIITLGKAKDLLKHVIYLPACKLTLDEQQVLFYRMREDNEYKKIAQRMKIKIDTVKKIGSRGLKKLKDYAKQTGDEVLEVILN